MSFVSTNCIRASPQYITSSYIPLYFPPSCLPIPVEILQLHSILVLLPCFQLQWTPRRNRDLPLPLSLTRVVWPCQKNSTYSALDVRVIDQGHTSPNTTPALKPNLIIMDPMLPPLRQTTLVPHQVFPKPPPLKPSQKPPSFMKFTMLRLPFP